MGENSICSKHKVVKYMIICKMKHKLKRPTQGRYTEENRKRVDTGTRGTLI
jgi:hypothetical protein